MRNVILANCSAVFDATIGKLWITRVWDGIDRNSTSSRQTLSRMDISLAFGLGLAGFLISIWAFAQTNRVPGLHTMIDIFLHADVPRMAQNMVSTEGNHGRTIVHPVRSLLLYPFSGLQPLEDLPRLRPLPIYNTLPPGIGVYTSFNGRFSCPLSPALRALRGGES